MHEWVNAIRLNTVHHDVRISAPKLQATSNAAVERSGSGRLLPPSAAPTASQKEADSEDGMLRATALKGGIRPRTATPPVVAAPPAAASAVQGGAAPPPADAPRGYTDRQQWPAAHSASRAPPRATLGAAVAAPMPPM
jgi:hypothetical protein